MRQIKLDSSESKITLNVLLGVLGFAFIEQDSLLNGGTLFQHLAEEHLRYQKLRALSVTLAQHSGKVIEYLSEQPVQTKQVISLTIRRILS